ncbi:Uncharacterized protein HZ326_17745 [Fusarium oxysporum f. sp. albedinis]|nr:Uncharacterized protein HZ326_17745 [Fusarium oxysporum f. sp. albedinis]
MGKPTRLDPSGCRTSREALQRLLNLQYVQEVDMGKCVEIFEKKSRAYTVDRYRILLLPTGLRTGLPINRLNSATMWVHATLPQNFSA